MPIIIARKPRKREIFAGTSMKRTKKATTTTGMMTHMTKLVNPNRSGRFKSLRLAFSIKSSWIFIPVEDRLITFEMGCWIIYCKKAATKMTSGRKKTRTLHPSLGKSRVFCTSESTSGVNKLSATTVKLPNRFAPMWRK